ncbi:MAG TPA: molybdopterin-dependent oxidoreductase [Nocardioidaceae bacterium]|nr:molybdopterin-dependent oxidoreductase [Nocardioidaceae bacterium]
MTEHLTTCPLCEVTCGLRIEVEDGEVVSVRGDADHPVTQGFICPKGTALQGVHHDPDRLRVPLVRRDGRLVETTWEVAFAMLKERLGPIVAEGGPDAVAWHLGTPLTHDFGTWIYGTMALRLLGAKQVYTSATVDHMPMMTAAGLMFGARNTGSFSHAAADIDNTALLVLIGCNPVVSNATGITAPRGRLKAIQERGGRIIVVDPARTQTAEMADLHLSVQPGGDAALFAAVTNVIFEEGLDRLHVLEGHLAGVEELRAAVSAFTPEAVSKRCGIEPDVIRELAREIATAPSAAIYGRVGAMTQEFGTVTVWFMYALAAVTGNLDRPGGMLWPLPAAAGHNTRGTPGRGEPFPSGRWHTQAGLPEVLGELPLGALADEILAERSPIRALITMASNGARSAPDSARYEEALSRVELVVSVDHYVNETTRFADIILPPPSPLERDHYDVFYNQLTSGNHTRWNDAVLSQEPGSYSEHDILLELTAVLAGFGDTDRGVIDDVLLSALVHDLVEEPGSVLAHLDPQDVLLELGDERGPERGLDLWLRAGAYGDRFGAHPGGLTLAELKRHPHGIELGPLQPRLPEVLRTPSGRVELAPEPLVADLDRVRQGLDDDPGDLVIVGRRQTRSLNSWLHNVPAMMRGTNRCTLRIHPDDAERRGLVDGGSCKVSSLAGSVEAVVEVTDAIRPGVVSLPHGWGHAGAGMQLSVAEQHPGANHNVLTGPGGFDVPSGTAVFSGVEVQIEAIPS